MKTIKEDTNGSIVFLTDYVFDYRSPNAICAIEIIKKIRQKAPDKKYYIFYLSNQKCSTKNYLDGIECISIKDSSLNRMSHSFKSSKQNLIKKILFNFISKFFAFINSFRFPISSNGVSKRAFKEIIKIENLKMVVGFCFPFEFAKSLVKIKKYNASVKCVFYPLDVISHGRYLSKGIVRQIQKINCKRLEKRTIKVVDYSILIETNKKDYSTRLKEYSKKIYYTGIPVLDMNQKAFSYSKNKNNILFTGSLNSRNPIPLLEMINKINTDFNKDYVVIFLGNNKVEHSYNFVFYKDFCTGSELENEIVNSFCLLNIGNLEPHLLPSKLLRYISTGKPIIHLSQIKDDPCELYLKDIENCFVIRTVDIKENFNNLCNSLKIFLENCDTRKTSALPESLRKSTIDYSAELILKLLNN